MLLAPGARELSDRVATPFAPSGALPSLVVPSKNVTDPVGVLWPWCVTVAVNVTLCPNAEGFAEEIEAVAVPNRFRNTATTPAVGRLTARSGLPSRFKSPTATASK